MIRLSIPGMIMVEAEWFAFEILTLATGQFGSSYLAAQSILITITSTTFQIPFPSEYHSSAATFPRSLCFGVLQNVSLEDP